MVDIIRNICKNKDCDKMARFNKSTEKKPLYCFEHKLENMVNVNKKNCQSEKCKNKALYGLINKKAQYCYEHKEKNMTNLELHNKCSILDCDKEFEFTIDNIKYCIEHCPDNKLKEKKKCKYCDIKEESKYICKDCNKIKNKKEWSIVRYLRKVIDTQFEYNSSKMLQGCSSKRPDIYFELAKHCVIVEIDEHQHNTYEDSCECARLNEIVNGIGGKSVIIIRYNPDTIKNNGIFINISNSDRLDLLVKTIKKELIKDYNKFVVKIIQLFYNDNYQEYKKVKKENITKLVTI